ncbi:MAG TPA: cytochrome c maturation protein CcmE [Chthonomonadaceae bacterium]|nr:cytochrome c maturation protein CcmE [Chthonomonadaceae bacterium]
MKKAYLIALLIIIVAAGFTLWAFSSAMTPYVDIRTARQMGSNVQVRGKILHNTVAYDMRQNVLRFQLEDKNKDRIEVVYHGAKPDAFDTAPETAAEGYVQRDASGQTVFESDKMAIKCPSKYDDSKTPVKPAGMKG